MKTNMKGMNASPVIAVRIGGTARRRRPGTAETMIVMPHAFAHARSIGSEPMPSPFSFVSFRPKATASAASARCAWPTMTREIRIQRAKVAGDSGWNSVIVA